MINEENRMYSQEEINEHISKGISELSMGLLKAFKNLGEAISRGTGSFAKLTALLTEYNCENKVIADSPNCRVKHLALHSKKARVRKKNRQRILREYYKNLEVMK